MKPHSEDLSQVSMLELFRVEAENQTAILNNGLLELERAPQGQQSSAEGPVPPLDPRHPALESLMRAAHSLKGAARIVGLQMAVRVAHAMEDAFVAAQKGALRLGCSELDVLFRGADLLMQLSKRTEADLANWETDNAMGIQEFLDGVGVLLAVGPEAVTGKEGESVSGKDVPPGSAPTPAQPLTGSPTQPPAGPSALPLTHSPTDPLTPQLPHPQPAVATPPKEVTDERVLRLSAENLNRLLGLAGESLVESRWLRPFADSLQRLKRQQGDLSQKLDELRRLLEQERLSDRLDTPFRDLVRQVGDCRQFLVDRIEELDLFDRRSAHLSHRLYLEVLRTRMRPFVDGARRFPRMVRDLARSLDKDVRLEIAGENTQVDRDILDRLETPLAHLLRNAVDHGCESRAQRARAGKPPQAVIRLEARHSAGMLQVTVADDGAGVQPDRIRQAVIAQKLTNPSVAEQLTESELLQFLFLPGFTLKETVTEISGRGVGLDVVQNMVKAVRGSIRVSTQPGRGMRFQLQLPLTLSVLRTLLVQVAGEPYAIPLTQITRTLKLARGNIEVLEGRHHFRFGQEQVGLLTAHQVLDCGQAPPPAEELPVVVLGDRNARYGLVVDRFLGERELVVQPLDPRLGKLKDISAAALMEDGSPVLIVDVDDLVRSIEKLIAAGGLAGLKKELEVAPKKLKKVLAVDDSLTVRELERKLLASRGYLADVAVDGMDGWNAVRGGQYDLVITDVDMPRMDGIELTTLIKKDPRLKTLPVMIVSYKDREEDRLRGLEAGADYYLTKGSFHDETLLQAVVDLIGEPDT